MNGSLALPPFPVFIDRRQAASDRRGTGRLPFVASVRHQVVPGPERVALGLSANLGLTGMKVMRPAAGEPDLPSHTPLHLAFELPDGGDLVEVAALVVFDRPRSEDSRFRVTGLRFARLVPQVETRIQAFLDRHGRPPAR